jgi:membrane dipeptidase
MNSNLHDSLLVIDGHSGSGLLPEYVPLLKNGGVDAYSVAIGWMKNARNTLDDMAFLYATLEATADDVTLVTSAAEIEAAAQAGKIGVIMEFENTLPLDGDLHMIDIFCRLGLRIMQLTYQERNLVGDGCTERTDAGLSDFGIQVIERMNRLGIVVSLSHTGKRTCMEAIEVSQAPVIFSHSNPRALCDHPRNIGDEEIEAVARKGGVVGICAIGNYLRADSTPENPSTIEDYMDHVDYVVRLVGIDHVGIGLDLVEFEEAFTKHGVMSVRNLPPERYNRIFKPAYIPPIETWNCARGLESVAQLPNLTQGLLGRGYSEAGVAKIMGGNFLRVFREVWGR